MVKTFPAVPAHATRISLFSETLSVEYPYVTVTPPLPCLTGLQSSVREASSSGIRSSNSSTAEEQAEAGGVGV